MQFDPEANVTLVKSENEVDPGSIRPGNYEVKSAGQGQESHADKVGSCLPHYYEVVIMPTIRR